MPSTAKKSAPALVNEGDVAPDFTLPTPEGSVTLSQFKGKKNVLVYFYPKDDTPGCTVQAKDARDLKPEFDKANTVIIGISKDDVKSHEKFCSKFSLNHIMASDEDTAVCQAYGAWGEKNMYGKKYMGIVRSSFLVDKKGIVAKAWHKVSPDGSMETALKAAQAL
ncbi:MAG: thioredoxin-dependent thiol peroxidase [Rhodospirillales bacterium 12-54-5]|nr:MAG: thioredoxin-dependent thiol peroxidase [Rhodospirillales bacterium 12-54-5]